MAVIQAPAQAVSDLQVEARIRQMLNYEQPNLLLFFL